MSPNPLGKMVGLAGDKGCPSGRLPCSHRHGMDVLLRTHVATKWRSGGDMALPRKSECSIEGRSERKWDTASFASSNPDGTYMACAPTNFEISGRFTV